jgi:hypothetical protein
MKVIALYFVIFCTLTLAANFFYYNKFPRMPWDFNLARFGIPLFLPFVTSFILTILIAVTLFASHVW